MRLANILDWFRKPKQHVFSMRQAIPPDIDFIMELICAESLNGHFAKFPNKEIKEVNRSGYQHLIEKGVMLESNRGFPCGDFAALTILIVNDEKVGFILCKSAAPRDLSGTRIVLVPEFENVCKQHFDDEDAPIELHMLAITPAWRRRGIARFCVRYLKGDGRKIIARCYPASTEALNLFLSEGFRVFATSPSGIKCLIFEH